MARIKLCGPIVSDDAGPIYKHFGYETIYPRKVRDAIDANPEGEDLIFEVNSTGGSVFNGIEIYSVLQGSTVHSVAEVQSVAASAASLLTCGCREVRMCPAAMLMIHDPALCSGGNIREHKEHLQALTAIKESVLNGYSARCGVKCSRQRLSDLMSKETFLTAQKAVELGLADSILGEDDGPMDAAKILDSAQMSLQSAVTASAGLPPYDELKARYDAEMAQQAAAPDDPDADPAGTPPAKNTDDWTARAALDIEMNRYI